jgi:hypothetical protein
MTIDDIGDRNDHRGSQSGNNPNHGLGAPFTYLSGADRGIPDIALTVQSDNSDTAGNHCYPDNFYYYRLSRHMLCDKAWIEAADYQREN